MKRCQGSFDSHNKAVTGQENRAYISTVNRKR
jgi:hypothetical protein